MTVPLSATSDREKGHFSAIGSRGLTSGFSGESAIRAITLAPNLERSDDRAWAHAVSLGRPSFPAVARKQHTLELRWRGSQPISVRGEDGSLPAVGNAGDGPGLATIVTAHETIIGSADEIAAIHGPQSIRRVARQIDEI